MTTGLSGIVVPGQPNQRIVVDSMSVDVFWTQDGTLATPQIDFPTALSDGLIDTVGITGAIIIQTPANANHPMAAWPYGAVPLYPAGIVAATVGATPAIVTANKTREYSFPGGIFLGTNEGLQLSAMDVRFTLLAPPTNAELVIVQMTGHFAPNPGLGFGETWATVGPATPIPIGSQWNMQVYASEDQWSAAGAYTADQAANVSLSVRLDALTPQPGSAIVVADHISASWHLSSDTSKYVNPEGFYCLQYGAHNGSTPFVPLGYMGSGFSLLSDHVGEPAQLVVGDTLSLAPGPALPFDTAGSILMACVLRGSFNPSQVQLGPQAGPYVTFP